MESVGVKVAVIREEPFPATVAVAPLSETTAGVADEYVHVPVVLEVGVVKSKDEAP